MTNTALFKQAAKEIEEYTQTLCETLEENYKQDSISSYKRMEITEGRSDYATKRLQEIENGTMIPYAIFSVETGRKYHKIIMRTACNADRSNDQKSVHAFVDRKTGEVYKPASWKGPAKHVRYDLRKIRDRQVLEVKCDWSGGYLYKV